MEGQWVYVPTVLDSSSENIAKHRRLGGLSTETYAMWFWAEKSKTKVPADPVSGVRSLRSS